MIRRKLPCAFARRAADSLLDEFSNHPYESRMVPRCSGTNHKNGLFVAESASFIVKVVENFHVVGQEANRRNHYPVDVSGFAVSEMIQDIWFQPRVLWSATATLVHKLPTRFWYAELLGHQPARFAQLLLVVRRR